MQQFPLANVFGLLKILYEIALGKKINNANQITNVSGSTSITCLNWIYVNEVYVWVWISNMHQIIYVWKTLEHMLKNKIQTIVGLVFYIMQGGWLCMIV